MEIDHEYTNDIVCPYCGYEFINSWEYTESEDEVSCQRCDQSFNLSVEIEISYTTSKIDD